MIQIFNASLFIYSNSVLKRHIIQANNISLQNKQTNISFASGKLRTLVYSGTKLQSHNIKANASSIINVKHGSPNLRV